MSYLPLSFFVRKITTQYTSLTWSPSSYLHLSPDLLPQGLGTSCSPILGRLSPTVVRPPTGCICSCVISSERPFLVQSHLMFPAVNFLQSTSFSHGSPHHLPYALLSLQPLDQLLRRSLNFNRYSILRQCPAHSTDSIEGLNEQSWIPRRSFILKTHLHHQWAWLFHLPLGKDPLRKVTYKPAAT